MANETPPPAVIDPRDATIASLQKKLSDAQAEVKGLKEDLKQATKGPAVPAGNYAFYDGAIHPIIGDYRADSNFIEVKRGNCDEGVTLLAIGKSH